MKFQLSLLAIGLMASCASGMLPFPIYLYYLMERKGGLEYLN
jgi:hypothetical protein